MSCCDKVIEAAATQTICECPAPLENRFWCKRHGCEKTKHFHGLCRTRADYVELWERGRGPMQGMEPPRFKLGDWLARLIHRATFGRVTPCTGCQSRAARLNAWGWRIADAWGRLWHGR